MRCICGCEEEDHYTSSLADWRPCKVCDCESYQARLVVYEQLRLPGIDWDQYEVK